MPTYQRCSKVVELLAADIMTRFASHKPLLDARVKIDFVFAFPDYDDNGIATNDALRLHGGKALGIARKIATKQRVLGRGDAEVCLDGDWWNQASVDQQAALLDHELHHLQVKEEANGRFCYDDINRPVIQMRPHDFEFGWFTIIAQRHPGVAIECEQAKRIKEIAGQYFWPEIEGEPRGDEGVSMSADGKVVELLHSKLKRAAERLRTASEESSDQDEGLIEQCVEVIRTEQKASVSLLQRRLRLGYSRAAKIMDELERRGMVGPWKGAEPRDILFEIANKQ